MNKGINLATGDIIGTLNSDDFYVDENVLTKVASAFKSDEIDAVYADLTYVDRVNPNKVVRLWTSKKYLPGTFKTGWAPAHPTFFVRKRVYETFGVFDLQYKIAADFELLFRMLEIYKVKVAYIPEVLVRMRMGGTTNNSVTNILRQNKEIIRVLEAHYGKVSLSKYLISKLSNRLSQYLNR